MTRKSPSRARWWASHYVVPVVGLLTLAVLVGHSSLDRASLEPFFDAEARSFPLRRAWFFEDVLHLGGRSIVVAMTVLLLLGALIAWRHERWSVHAKRFAYVATCVLLTVSIAGLWKKLANQTTPWNTIGFGGEKPWPELSGQSIFSLLGSPGAHAASGYAWVSLYFVGASMGTRYRWLWLIPGLLLGTLFAVGQHVRGAHQPSHEPIAIAIAWLVAGGTAATFRVLGWLNWSERQQKSGAARDPWTEPFLPWLVAAAVAMCGAGFFALDQVASHVGDRYPEVHDTVEYVELGGTVIGLGVGAWLLVEKLAALRARSARRLEEERERRLQLLGRMAASVAHEVRNPLQTIRLIVDEQRMDIPALASHSLSPELEACLERIDRAVDLVYRLARPEAGEDAHTDLIAAARESVVSLQRINPDRAPFIWRTTVEYAAVGLTHSDARVVLDNLLRNAMEASLTDQLVELGIERDGEYWSLQIRNPGQLSARSGPTLRTPGLGLGVAISRQIAANVGGSIEITEGDGHVSCDLRLPNYSSTSP